MRDTTPQGSYPRSEGKAAQSVKAFTARLKAGHVSAGELNAMAQDPRLGVQRLVQEHREKMRLAQQRAVREAARLRAMLSFEDKLYSDGVRLIAGVDEAGAGPLAGPVYAAAVILPPGVSLDGIDDSKKLLPEVRERLAVRIKQVAIGFGIAQASAAEIDQLNIRQACLLAMRRAVLLLPQSSYIPNALDSQALHVLVDAHTIPNLPLRQTAIIGGDSRSQSIAAASILAKTARDAAMCGFAQVYPGYGFEAHKGYGTAVHLEQLQARGPSPIHRRSFAPVREALHADGAAQRYNRSTDAHGKACKQQPG